MTDKFIQCVLKVTTPTEYRKYMVFTITLSHLIFFTNVSGMDPNERWPCLATILWPVANFEAMVICIYVVNQTCGNDI